MHLQMITCKDLSFLHKTIGHLSDLLFDLLMSITMTMACVCCRGDYKLDALRIVK